jgi:hypothetical protein
MDDVYDVRRALRGSVLGELGYRVTRAASAQAAAENINVLRKPYEIHALDAALRAALRAS